MAEKVDGSGDPLGEDLQRILLEDLLAYQPHARIGRCLSGIIHNLNGHLQNLQMQAELLQRSVEGAATPLNPETLSPRLQHLTEELDNLSELLRFWGQQVDYENLLREVKKLLDGYMPIPKALEK